MKITEENQMMFHIQTESEEEARVAREILRALSGILDPKVAVSTYNGVVTRFIPWTPKFQDHCHQERKTQSL